MGRACGAVLIVLSRQFYFNLTVRGAPSPVTSWTVTLTVAIAMLNVTLSNVLIGSSTTNDLMTKLQLSQKKLGPAFVSGPSCFLSGH